MRPLASIGTSKGCPYRRSFCAQWKVAGGRYPMREPAKVVEELFGIEEKYVFFADDESRTRTLASVMRDCGIRKRTFLYGHSDAPASNGELFEMWKQVGLERVASSPMNHRPPAF